MSVFDILPWWSWLFGTLGLVGVIALIVLAPAAATLAEQGIAAALGRMLQTRVGVAIIVGAIALFVGHVAGGLYVESKCAGKLEDQRLAAEAAGKKRDADVASATERKYAPVIKQLGTSADARNLEADSYERKMLGAIAGGAGSCQLGDEPLRLRRR